jgi:hypothetical protein
MDVTIDHHGIRIREEGEERSQIAFRNSVQVVRTVRWGRERHDVRVAVER